MIWCKSDINRESKAPGKIEDKKKNTDLSEIIDETDSLEQRQFLWIDKLVDGSNGPNRRWHKDKKMGQTPFLISPLKP